jgi:seryl-tRNA synthetase
MEPQIVSQIVSLSAKNRSIQSKIEGVKLDDKKLNQKIGLISQQLTNVGLMLEKMSKSK